MKTFKQVLFSLPHPHPWTGYSRIMYRAAKLAKREGMPRDLAAMMIKGFIPIGTNDVSDKEIFDAVSKAYAEKAKQ